MCYNPRQWDTPLLKAALESSELKDPSVFAPHRHDLDNALDDLDRDLWLTQEQRVQAEANNLLYGKKVGGYVHPTILDY